VHPVAPQRFSDRRDVTLSEIRNGLMALSMALDASGPSGRPLCDAANGPSGRSPGSRRDISAGLITQPPAFRSADLSAGFELENSETRGIWFMKASWMMVVAVVLLASMAYVSQPNGIGARAPNSLLVPTPTPDATPACIVATPGMGFLSTPDAQNVCPAMPNPAPAPFETQQPDWAS
jgi:hypothetical protein